MIFHTVEMIVFHLIVMNILHVPAKLPEFVHRTEHCPIPNNITDWQRSSNRLGCKHDILSKNPREQKFVYHCVPTSFLNETVEFCGKRVPSDGGYCPVYTYEFGMNESPNFANCSGFLEGCTEKFFFSKQVFKYPACNNINREKKCYRSDPTCCTDSCANMRSISNAREKNSKGNSEENTTNMAVLGIVICFPFLLIAVCLSVFLLRVKWKGYMEIRREKGEIPELYRVKLDDFISKIGEQLKPGSLRRLKTILQGNSQTKNKRRYKRLERINDGVELLKFMDHLYDFSMNIYILQGFLERIDEDNLVEKCIEFVERKTNTCINKYYKKGDLEGYKKVCLKLPKEDVFQIPAWRILALRRNLANLIDAKVDDIVIRGISEGSVIVHTEMRPFLFRKIKKLGIFGDFIFKKYHISEVYTEQQCLYTSQKKRRSNGGKSCFHIENCLTIEEEQDVISQITELPELPDLLSYINIAIMGVPIQGDFTFVNICTDALKSRTPIFTIAALMTTSSKSTTPLTVISSKTKSGRPIQIRILESENIQTMDSVVDSSTCANEASTRRRGLSELDRKIHCVVYALHAFDKTLYGYDEIDNEKIRYSVLNQEKPKLLLLWTRNISKVSFQDVFRFRVQACDDFGLPLRFIMPACDPLSNETHTNEALKSLLFMIDRAIEYASENCQ